MSKPRILIACDHAGYELKESVKKNLQDKYELVDFGTSSTDSIDFPDYADKLCRSLKSEFGILICGSGQGMAMRANKYPHIRAALCYNSEISKLSREHNDANVICLGARFLQDQEAIKLISIFLETPFAGGRHEIRVKKINQKLDGNAL